MGSWQECVIQENASIMDAVKAIDKGGMQIALIVDDGGKLKGVLTDGDIRRAVINKVDFTKWVGNIMKRNPSVAKVGQSDEEIRELMKVRQVHQIPVIDDEERVRRVALFLDVIDRKRYDNIVVIMAGGLGSRLMPLTEKSPKPLLKVGSKPILEIILESFLEKGFYRFYFSVNYKAEMIESYFGDGSAWNAEIKYVREEKKLGTAGSLSLLPEVSDKPIIVMNGDILTKVDYASLVGYHMSEGAIATMAVREYTSRIPYGVIDVDGNIIVSVKEKPTETYMVNAGIYVLSPSAVREVRRGEYLDMPGLYDRLIDSGKKTIVFPIREYWLDIGRIEDFEKAQDDYEVLWR